MSLKTYTEEQAREILHKTPRQMQELRYGKKIRFHKSGNTILYLEEYLIEFLKKHEEAPCGDSQSSTDTKTGEAPTGSSSFMTEKERDTKLRAVASARKIVKRMNSSQHGYLN